MVSNLLKLFHEAHPYLLALGTAEGSIRKTGGNVKLNLFMQNKPNFPNDPMNISPVTTKYYSNFCLLGHSKNKPNSNPIKPNFKLFAVGGRTVKIIVFNSLNVKSQLNRIEGVIQVKLRKMQFFGRKY